MTRIWPLPAKVRLSVFQLGGYDCEQHKKHSITLIGGCFYFKTASTNLGFHILALHIGRGELAPFTVRMIRLI